MTALRWRLVRWAYRRPVLARIMRKHLAIGSALAPRTGRCRCAGCLAREARLALGSRP